MLSAIASINVTRVGPRFRETVFRAIIKSRCLEVSGVACDMSKRKNTTAKKGRAKSRKVEYDEEDISSEHESDVEDAESGTNVDGEDAAEDDLTDVSNIPELPSPEVTVIYFFSYRYLSQVNTQILMVKR